MKKAIGIGTVLVGGAVACVAGLYHVVKGKRTVETVTVKSKRIKSLGEDGGKLYFIKDFDGNRFDVYDNVLFSVLDEGCTYTANVNTILGMKTIMSVQETE